MKVKPIVKAVKRERSKVAVEELRKRSRPELGEPPDAPPVSVLVRLIGNYGSESEEEK